MSFYRFQIIRMAIGSILIVVILFMLLNSMDLCTYDSQDFSVEAIVVDKEYTPNKMVMFTYYPEKYRTTIKYNDIETVVFKEDFYNKYEIGDSVPAWIRVKTNKETGAQSISVFKAMKE